MDLSIGEEYEGDTEFVRWAQIPGGHMYRVEGGLPSPHEGPTFSPNADDGLIDRFMLRRVNGFLDRAMKGHTPTRCYLEVWDVDADDDEELVYEETTSDIDQGRERGWTLVAEIKSGRPPSEP